MQTKFKIAITFFIVLLGITVSAQKVIILDKHLNESIALEAETTVILKPGFNTAPGIVFNAAIDTLPLQMQVAQGDDYQLNENLNWISSITFDISGKITSSGISYFDALGKPTQSQTTDIKTGKIWVTEVLYDNQGRPALQTLSAPITEEGVTFTGYNTNFITLSTSDVESITDENTNLPIISNSPNTLGWYYSNNNDSEEYQDITANPYVKAIYSTLNPGVTLKTLGGNKILIDTVTNEEKWLRGFSYSLPAAQELYYVFGKDYFEGGSNEYHSDIVINKIIKTVNIDIHGNETVIFSDSEGKVLAASRSGGTKKNEVVSVIGKQGYVDVHIPKGISNSEIQFLSEGYGTYTVYDLRNEKEVLKSEMTGGNLYRVQFSRLNHPQIDSYTYIQSNGYIGFSYFEYPTTNYIFTGGIRYPVNYYDFTLNYHDKAGRLTKSLQPKGFDDTCLDSPIQITVNHNTTFMSTFMYNSLGQLLETSSPDEGTAKFKYRKDGQIRFSQNDKQLAATPIEFSYTNYDNLGRPIESGVLESIAFITADPDTESLPTGTQKEQHFTLYDIDDITNLHTALTSEGITTSNYPNQNFLAGNVSKTYTSNPNTTTTWYSYDIYGRVTWLVQQIDNLGTKTIDYEYDPVTSEVTKVYYQKYKSTETFIHKYDYSVTGQLVNVETSTDDITFTDQARYEYYETGALKRVELADNLQGTDYVYTLAGQLKAINSPNIGTTNIDVFRDPGKDGINGLREDIFGMSIDYHYKDYSREGKNISSFLNKTGAENQYNGNIAAIRWNTSNSGDTNGDYQNAYSYYYNNKNWLEHGVFYRANEVTNVGKLLGNYDYYTNYAYDTNGNITYLQRRGFDVNAVLLNYADYAQGTMKLIDNLTYDYQNGNQLDHVDDTVTEVTNADDIKDQAPGNYTYNEIGQLTDSAEEGITYSYNASGLVNEVQKNDIPLVKFFYSDKGQRERKESFDTGGTLISTTHYVRDAAGSVMSIYTNGIQQEIPVYGASRLGVYYKQADNTIYQLTDHLGNVRALISKDSEQNLVHHGNTDYYPGGMAMPGRNNQSAEGYRYGYQGEFAETDPETGKPAFQIRLYDPRINRWLSPDPMGQYHSPYMAMDNRPNMSVDPTGGCTVGVDCPEEFNWMGDGTWVMNEIVLGGNGGVNWGSASLTGGGLIDFSLASESFWQNVAEKGYFTKSFVESSMLDLSLIVSQEMNFGKLKKNGQIRLYGKHFTTGNQYMTFYNTSKYAKVGANLVDAYVIGSDLFDIYSSEGNERQHALRKLYGDVGVIGITRAYPPIGVILTAGQLMSTTSEWKQGMHDAQLRKNREKYPFGKYSLPEGLEFRQRDY